MNNKNYWEKTRYIPKTSFDSYLAKDKKKEYNQNNPTTYSTFTQSYQKNKNAFDNDAVANSALDYLYSSNNRGKTQSFLENNGFPTAEDREYNKEYYGVQEENNRMQDLLKFKTNSILNPKLPDKNDRLFLSGFLGDEEEERNYQNEIANVNRAREELNNAFRGSIFESALNGNSTPTIQKINSTPQISHAILRNPNDKAEPKPIGTHDLNKPLSIEQYSLKRDGEYKTKPSNPDAIEFGEDSETYKILQDLSKRWYATSDSAEKDRLHEVAEKVRMYHRQGTPIVDRHDAIMNLLHENKKTAQDYQKRMTYGIPGFLYRMTDGDFFLDSSTYLIGMVDKGDWDYKYNDDWRVKYDYFDGEDMDTPGSNYRNWKKWMYFDGYLISADKLGNMNMAYVGKNMGLAEWVYKNFETTDKDDEFWVQYGIDLAKSGR